MSKPHNRKVLAAAVGAAMTAALAAAPVAHAEQPNPFGLTALAGGYMLGSAHADDPPKQEEKKDDAKDEEGRCGEGRCGEGRCGGHADDADDKDDKDDEGRCGGTV